MQGGKCLCLPMGSQRHSHKLNWESSLILHMTLFSPSKSQLPEVSCLSPLLLLSHTAWHGRRPPALLVVGLHQGGTSEPSYCPPQDLLTEALVLKSELVSLTVVLHQLAGQCRATLCPALSPALSRAATAER